MDLPQRKKRETEKKCSVQIYSLLIYCNDERI
jgi:hypothetical protein